VADQLHKFIFEGLPIRGEIIQLADTFEMACEHVDYPQPVQHLIGQALAATGLLASSIKFAGRLTLQLQGDGPVSPVVVQGDNHLQLRGMAHCQAVPLPDAQLNTLCGDGQAVITLTPDAAHDKQYQGIVPLERTSLAATLERYFIDSEQLPTRLWLVSQGHRAAGLFLQRLPGELADADAWERMVKLAETVTADELLSLPAEVLLKRLYHQETVRLFDSSPVKFKCTCSRERVANMLRGLGQQDLELLIEERGEASVTCEFCGNEQVFDGIDVRQLFSVNSPLVGSNRSH